MELVKNELPNFLIQYSEVEILFKDDSLSEKERCVLFLNFVEKMRNLKDGDGNPRFDVIESIYSNTQIYINGGDESHFYRVREEAGKGKVYEKKMPYKSLFFEEYNLKLNSKGEDRINAPREKDITFGKTRHIRRTSFTDDLVSVDCSIVRVDDKEDYEIEVELLEPSGDLVDDYMEMIILVYSIYHDDSYDNIEELDTVPTSSEIREVRSLLREKLTDNTLKPNKILKEMKLRDVNKQDLQYGRIVGGRCRYNASVKNDGEKKFLVINTVGIWLCSDPLFKLVHRWSPEKKHTDGPNQYNCILEGELSRKGNHPLFHIFDCILIGGTELTSEVHADRLEAFRLRNTENDRLFPLFEKVNEYFKLLNKEFRTIQSIYPESGKNDYFGVLRSLYEKQREENCDGLVLIPNCPYFLVSEYSKDISVTPSALKMKPKNLLTVDLRVRVVGKNKNHSTQDLPSIDLYVQNGVNEVPFHMEVEKNNELYNSDGNIVEFKIEDNKLVFYRKRIDKPRPNSLQIVNKILHSSLDLHDLVGNNMFYLRAYHNRVKRMLYMRNKGKTLLDLGSGALGDMNKWKEAGYTRIIAVEPSKINREEGYRRLEANKLGIIIYTVPLDGSDHVNISRSVRVLLGERVDTVSIMLSATFFWNPERYDNMVKVINKCLKPGGRVIYLTADGHLIRQKLSVNGEIKKSGYSITPINDNTYSMTIKGSILPENQKEWYVNISDLVNDLSVSSDYEYLKIANNEVTHTDKNPSVPLLMTEEELLLTSMYTYGSIIYDRETNMEFDPFEKLSGVDVNFFFRDTIMEAYYSTQIKNWLKDGKRFMDEKIKELVGSSLLFEEKGKYIVRNYCDLARKEQIGIVLCVVEGMELQAIHYTPEYKGYAVVCISERRVASVGNIGVGKKKKNEKILYSSKELDSLINRCAEKTGETGRGRV